MRAVSRIKSWPAPAGKKGMVEQFSASVHAIWPRLREHCREFLQKVGMNLATYLELNQESEPDGWSCVRYRTFDGGTGPGYSNCMSNFLTVGAPPGKNLT
jgi:hypothetical protein